MLNTMAKKKSEPAERIRQLMESLQGGGGKNNNEAKHKQASAFTGQQSTSTVDSTPRMESSPVSPRQQEEETERETQAINHVQYLSNDGMHAIVR